MAESSRADREGPLSPVTRREWRNALKASGLPPSARLVALILADYWPSDGEVIRCDDDTLMAQTGLKRTALYDARRALRMGGWLIQVEQARQHYSPRYVPALPSQPSGIRTAEPVDNTSQPSGIRTADGRVLAQPSGFRTPEPVDNPASRPESGFRTAPGVRNPDSGPDSFGGGGYYPPPPEPHQSPPREVTPISLDLPATLAAIVVDHAPAARSAVALMDVCQGLAEDGWTAQTFRKAIAPCHWHGAGPGAVIKALRGFAPPTPEKPTKAPCPDPACTGGWLGYNDAGRLIPCPHCKPHRVAPATEVSA